MKKNPLVWFFVLTLAISWLLGFPAALSPEKYGGLEFLSTFGPALAAFLVGGVSEGKNGIKKLLQSLFQWRVKWVWYLVVLFGPALTMAVAMLLYQIWNRSFSLVGLGTSLSLVPQHTTALFLVSLFIFISIWGEEIGWRGFALPRLQRQYHPIWASLILGAIWAVWHLPLFFTAGSVHTEMGFPFFFFATLGYSVLYSWIFNGANESVFIICMLHAVNNATVTYSMIFFKPLITEPVFALSVLALFDVLVIFFTRSSLLTHKESVIIQPYA